MHYNVTLRRVCATIVAVEQQYYTARVFVALGNRYATRTRHTVIYGLSGSTIFFHFYHIHVKISEKKVTGIKNKFFSLQLLSETFPILRTERDVIINVC